MNRSIYLLVLLASVACFVNLVHAGDDSPSMKTKWKDKDGYDLPGDMTLVDYASLPVTLTHRRGKLFVNGSPASKLSARTRTVLETVAGCDCNALVERLKQQRDKPLHLRVEFAVLRQIGNGQLLQMPVAQLAPADRLAAMQGGQQILQQRQLQAQVAAAQRRSLAAAVARGSVPAVATQPTGAADFEQEGEFEGQFGDQSGPDGPGGVEK
ncbi:MAG: hypothetical protein ACYC3X_21430 [Pirellulaceae bacterium]